MPRPESADAVSFWRGNAEQAMEVLPRALLRSKRSQNAKHWYSALGLVPRTLTVVDERIQTLHRVDIKQTDAAEVYHRVAADNNPKSAEAAKHLHNLLRFMTDRAKLGGRNLETPITGGAAWSAARDCRWFNTEEAKKYMERPPAGACRDEHWAADQSQLEAVFEFEHWQ
jgi:hypothetical protein